MEAKMIQVAPFQFVNEAYVAKFGLQATTPSAELPFLTPTKPCFMRGSFVALLRGRGLLEFRKV
jgi:hypothetical protein